LSKFLNLIDDLASDTAPLTGLVDRVITGSGLMEMYRKEKGGKGEARVENLEELVNAARGFDPVPEEMGEMAPLEAFLAHAALEAGEGRAAGWEDCVQLMTLHAAKGLEFPVVFLVGLEEKLFPHYRVDDEPERLEEERRLAYVGITRARRRLTLTHAEKRRLYGTDTYSSPSRFLDEIPAELTRDVRTRTTIRRPVASARAEDNGCRLGQSVRHPTFGEGVVVDLEGRGEHARAQVKFAEAGAKWLVLAYAKLKLLEE
jgi:DNA helicase-2/ATP-dependent DNA helicase PcrA